ncbi:hypothetical protein [Nitrosovibrio sp. Nv4]|uniref:hypothetical protein n=1 Tax=Nitrosovibrio sp. Nv4 TaxID=1945880 RepID=UPI000BCDD46F|nr:hypothetical protein [Nitrosovibrio sp. Nv4]SOD42366.1 hypothetical protein SAMN06298226_2705 [Nitrosovibrio sp. Nv4]
MTMFQRQKLKEYAEKMNAEADKGADSLLDRLKASKWTAVMLLGAAVVMIIFLWAIS